jgi:hypothetical protein
VKGLTDLFHLARDHPAVELTDSFGCTGLLQKLLLRK